MDKKTQLNLILKILLLPYWSFFFPNSIQFGRQFIWGNGKLFPRRCPKEAVGKTLCGGTEM